MFDTTSLTQAITPPLCESELIAIGASHPKGRTKWVINPRDGEVFPSLTFQMQPNGIQYLTARQSLPRTRHGHNAILLTSQCDIHTELGLLAHLIYKRTGIKFDPLTANVTSVDFTQDFKVGRELIIPTLRRLEPRHLPRYRRIRFDHGIAYKQRGSSILIYSKYQEIYKQIKEGAIPQQYHINALQAADGVLRVESRHTIASLERLRRKGICKTRQAINVLTPKLSNHVILAFLAKIQFNDAVNVAESNKALDRLIEARGSRAAMRLNGFLTMIDSYGSDFWEIESLNFPRTTYFNNLRECRSAGVWEV
jgi:hypothetical protein